LAAGQFLKETATQQLERPTRGQTAKPPRKQLSGGTAKTRPTIFSLVGFLLPQRRIAGHRAVARRRRLAATESRTISNECELIQGDATQDIVRSDLRYQFSVVRSDLRYQFSVVRSDLCSNFYAVRSDLPRRGDSAAALPL